jgi:hypothetical protein
MLDGSSGSDDFGRMQYRMVGGDRKEYGPISEEQLRQWIAEGRASGETLVQVEGGVWRKLSTYPEFAAALQAAAPAATPPPSISPGVSSGPPNLPSPTAYPFDARARVQGPAIALIVVGLLSLPMAALSLVSSLFSDPMAYRDAFGHVPELEQMEHVFEAMGGWVGAVTAVVNLLIAGLIAWAGFRMLALRNYVLCVVAAVVALIPCLTPCPCCCLGIPIGIWALVVLLNDQVKAAFH